MSTNIPPIAGQVMLTGVEFDTGYEDTLMNLDQTDDPDLANAITSAVQGSNAEAHKVILDVDFPVYAVPSSTPGHFHLYIDKIVSFDHLLGILHAMSDAGVVQRGYAEASEAQGFTTVRAPWTKKVTT
jgi:hypothetical protein